MITYFLSDRTTLHPIGKYDFYAQSAPWAKKATRDRHEFDRIFKKKKEKIIKEKQGKFTVPQSLPLFGN